MNKFIQDVSNNLSFVLICAVIVAAIGIAAHLTERLLPERRKVTPARRVSIIGICAALATVLHMLDFPLPFLAPTFYKLDFSEVPVLLAGFYLGPSATVACEGIKILLKLLLKGTSTAFVGDFANFVVGCCFVLPATLIYHLHKSKRSAIVGLTVGFQRRVPAAQVLRAVSYAPGQHHRHGHQHFPRREQCEHLCVLLRGSPECGEGRCGFSADHAAV